MAVFLSFSGYFHCAYISIIPPDGAKVIVNGRINVRNESAILKGCPRTGYCRHGSTCADTLIYKIYKADF
jgi:hypothetical protein